MICGGELHSAVCPSGIAWRPIVTRGIPIGIAGHKDLQALPSRSSIFPQELQEALAAPRVEIEPSDAVFIWTGTLRYWGEAGADKAKLAKDKVYEFLYICTPDKIKGTSAGFTLRPIAI